MHTLHYIAVEATSIEEAFDKVESFLIPSEEGYRNADWSDWHVVGGGRWNVGKDEDWRIAYEDGRQNMVVSYKDNPDKFKEVIEGVRKARINEMNRLMKEVNTDKFISDMVDYISNGGELPKEQRYSLTGYYIKSAASLMEGYWTPDSYYYDMEWHGAIISPLMERLDNPEQAPLQYLVPVDFHF